MNGLGDEDAGHIKAVCVIGAGTAGLCALRHSLQNGFRVTCYEQSNEVGGTWVYKEVDPLSGDDEVHSSMYEGLRTNLPKEVMGYPDYPYPQHLDESFIDSKQVLNFLQSYMEYFELKSHIKLQHTVIRVRPIDSNSKWEVCVRENMNNKVSVAYFDFVFVCNGHYTTPQYPEIKGMHLYKGQQMHSHLYRKPTMFTGERVLIIGAGPSGMDLAHHISREAEAVYLSHHLDPAPDTSFMLNVVHKPDIQCFTPTGAIFNDGSEESFSFVLHCTGYKYTFPFLSCDCGVYVRDNGVYPMFKHCINIQHPSMAIIGLPFLVLPTQCFDLQVRFALKFFSQQKALPSHAEMMDDLERDLQTRKTEGLTKRQVHQMGDRQFEYYQDLCNLAEIQNIKPAILKIMKDCKRKYIYELATYRNNVYKIINDEEFVKMPLKK